MDITIEQYSEHTGLSYPAVTKRIRENNSLPGVRRIIKFHRSYILQVKKDFFSAQKRLVVSKLPATFES
jgi:hypothetical protein